MVPPLVFASIFALASRNPPAIQAYYKIAVFSDFFAVLRYLSNFFAVMRGSATPNVPLRKGLCSKDRQKLTIKTDVLVSS